jgi:hypothetical protein
MKYFDKLFKKSLNTKSINEPKKHKRFYVIIFYLTGIAAVIWFLIRVIPKPSRVSYPCQRATFPIASTFVIWISVNVLSFIGIKKIATFYRRKTSIKALALLLVMAIFYVMWLTIYPSGNTYASTKVSTELFVPTDSANSPIGTARGIFPGRVTWAFDTTFTKWVTTKGQWWDSAYTDYAVVSDMVSRSIKQLSGKDNDTLAWDAIFKYHNTTHGKGNIGYQAGEKIAIKLSLVQSTNASGNGGNNNFTPPQTALALLRQLVYNAGVDADNITFYDIMRAIPTSVTTVCRKEFPKVHFVGASKGTYQEKYVRDTTTIHWSEKLDKEINGGNTAYLPTIITEATYIINLANLKGHRYVGVTGCSKNHFGSMSSDGDSNTPHAIGLHCYVTVHDFIIPGSAEWSFTGRAMGTYNTLVDLMGHKDLGGKTLLFINDGLFSVPRENDPNTKAIKWQQTPFNNHYSSCIFMSQDNVAIESVAIDFLRTEQAINTQITQPFEDGTGTHNVVFGNIDNYLHEAAQADNPPSGTKYAPNGDSVRLTSLGVHEHWNNAIDKQYSRNLGKNVGIELVEVTPTLQAPTSLTLSSNTDNTSKLSWSNNTTEGNIIIYKSVNSSTNYKIIAQINGNATSYTDTDLLGIQTCYYRLKRITDTTYSAFSNEVKTTPVSDVPGVINYTFNIYPNPANNILNLKFSYPSSRVAKMAIIDFSGKQIQCFNFQNNGETISRTIDISNLRKGIYIVELSIGNAKTSRMLMVQ